MALDPAIDFPLGANRPDLIKTPSGSSVEDLDLNNLRAGVLAGEDVRATSDTLMLQAEIAEATGSHQLAENLRRGAELTRVPDDVVLSVYGALRPGRSSRSGLVDWAKTLEEEYDAPRVAAFVREAAAAYADRGLIK